MCQVIYMPRAEPSNCREALLSEGFLNPIYYPKVGAFWKHANICAKNCLTSRLENAPTRVWTAKLTHKEFRFALPIGHLYSILLLNLRYTTFLSVQANQVVASLQIISTQ